MRAEDRVFEGMWSATLQHDSGMEEVIYTGVTAKVRDLLSGADNINWYDDDVYVNIIL